MLKRLQEVAIIQSTESSNRIEGITASPDRLRELMAQKTTPANRPEEEIAGYRDVLATIHASHEHVKVQPGVILQLHRDLYKFSAERGGHGSQVDNEIADVRPDGTRTTRFKCVSAVLTPNWMERLCDDFNRLWQEEAIEPLLLIPAFVLDFLCIHPFRDGNGRMARLLTLLLLYEVGLRSRPLRQLGADHRGVERVVLRHPEGIQPRLARGPARPVALARLLPWHHRRGIPGTGTADRSGGRGAGGQADDGSRRDQSFPRRVHHQGCGAGVPYRGPRHDPLRPEGTEGRRQDQTYRERTWGQMEENGVIGNKWGNGHGCITPFLACYPVLGKSTVVSKRPLNLSGGGAK